MEAVGAAGAIVGLAGSALTGLQSLGEFINVLQEGKVDLEFTQRRLAEHEFRLSELRTEYDALPNGAVTAEEKLLLDDCIKDSHDELQRYQRLLEKSAKTRTRGKTLQKMEGAFRTYLHGEDFKKHRSLIQDRTLRLQAYSERVNRFRVTESFQSILSSTAQYHAEDITAHQQTLNAVNIVSDNFERHLQQSLASTSSLQAQVTAVVGNYNEQTQTLIQSSLHSTVQQVNESLREHILPMIQGLHDESRARNRAPLHQYQRGSAHRSRANLSRSDDYSKELSIRPQFAQRSVYRTPLGRLRVAYMRNNHRVEDSNDVNWQTAYWVSFDPYGFFSQNFVEWRLFLNAGPSGPPTTIWCDIGTICEDSEVLDALGLMQDGYRCNHRTNDIGVPVKHTNTCQFTDWRTKPPDPHKLKRLLDQRRFRPGDSLRSTYDTTEKIVELFISAHRQLCERPHRPIEVERFGMGKVYCFCEASQLIKNGDPDLPVSNIIKQAITKSDEEFEYLSHFYPRYYETLELLFQIGCEPDDWRFVFAGVARNTCHILEHHTRYASTDYFRLYSAMTLVNNAAARPCLTKSFFSTGYAAAPCESGASGTIPTWTVYESLPTFTGNLLPFRDRFKQHLEDIVFDIGGAEALNKDLQNDRWLLTLMSYIEPRLRTLLTANPGSLRRHEVLDFSIERTCEEIRSAQKGIQMRVANYVVYHGNCSLVQLLVRKGFDPVLFLDASARRGNFELLEIVMESCLKTSQRPTGEVIHHRLISARIAQDPLFANRLLDLLVPSSLGISHQAQTLDGFFTTPNHDGFLRSSWTLTGLMLTGSSDLPEYIRIVIQGCIARYEQANCRFLGIIRLYIRYGLCAQGYFDHDDTEETEGTREDPGVSTHSYHEILQRLVLSPVFRCGLEYVPNGKSSSEEPGTGQYTPLMMALHGGMVPTVEILLAAGAEIDSSASCGMTALQLAEQNSSRSHPRACWGSSQHDFSEVRSGMWRTPQLISSNVDDEMLEMLRNALRSRGQRVPDPSPPMTSKSLQHWLNKVFWRIMGQVIDFLGWLFRPAVGIIMADLHERLIYAAVVWTFGLLSVARLLYLEMGRSTADMLTGMLKLLSRPIVMIPFAAYVIRTIWRCYLAALE